MCGQYWQLLLTDYFDYDGPPPVPQHDREKFAPHMDYLGRVKRFTPYKDKVRRDRFFDEFVRSGAIKYNERYKMAQPNRQAMTLSISKYNRPQPTEFNEKAWAVSCDWALKHFGPEIGKTRIIDHDKARRDLDRTTSAGYPWSRYWQNKGQFLDSEEAPKVEKMFWDALPKEEHERLIAFWTASLKRELRPVEKLAENKIRTFTASPTELSVATTRMCWDMNNRFYESNNKTWSFVGCSKYYRGFDRLYRRLNKHPNAFELDESSFDASLFRKAMESVRDLRWEMYHDIEKTPENKKRLWAIYDQIINSVIVLDNGEVVVKHTGNPSGSANTIVDNTLILFMLFAYAFIMLALESKDTEKYATFECFMRFVEAALNGDDNTFTVADEIVGWFNAKALARIWTLIGVETKSPNFNPRKLEECEFLSHAFRKFKDCWVPVPERDKALCSLMWGAEFEDVRFTLLRAHALRMETWTDPECRKDIQLFIDFLRKQYKQDLIGTIPDTDLTMLRINAVWKTDAELERLYCMPPVLECSGKEMHAGKTALVNDFDLLYSAQLMMKWVQDCETIPLMTRSRVIDDCKQFQMRNKFAVLDGVQEMLSIPQSCEPACGPVPDDYVDPPINQYRGKSVNKSFSYESERNRNVHADSMPKGKGKQHGKGGNPSKKELQRRQRQSQRDKSHHANKGKSHGHKPKGRGPKTREFVESKTYSAPVATGSTQTVMKGAHSRRHCHPTFIGTFTTGTDGKFTEAKAITLNPAQQGCDPWGFVIAGRYQKWGRNGKASPFRIRLEPRLATTVDGETFIQINYNSQCAAPTSSQQLLNGYRASRASAWLKNQCVADGSEFSQKKLYCRMGNQPSGTDIREYDFGNVFIFYEGITSARTFDIWLDIDVMLYDPIIPDDEMASIADFMHWHGTYQGGAVITGSVASANGAAAFSITGTSSKLIDFTGAPGYYSIMSYWRAVGGAFTSFILPTLSGTMVSVFSTVSAALWNAGGSADYHVIQATSHTAAQTFNIPIPAGAAATDTLDIWIQWLGFNDSNPAPPSLRRVNNAKAEKKTDVEMRETNDRLVAQLVSNPMLLAQLKKALAGDDYGYFSVSGPPSPQPATAAAAGGKSVPPLPVGTVEVKTDVPKKVKGK